MKATLLTMATIRSGTIVFMKNDENTRNAASEAATTIHISHLDSARLAESSPRSTRAFKRRADVSSRAEDAPSNDFQTAARETAVESAVDPRRTRGPPSSLPASSAGIPADQSRTEPAAGG